MFKIPSTIQKTAPVGTLHLKRDGDQPAIDWRSGERSWHERLCFVVNGSLMQDLTNIKERGAIFTNPIPGGRMRPDGKEITLEDCCARYGRPPFSD